MISFGRHVCNNFSVATEKEWILTNTKGSYSSSTILCTNTRRHHGLLVTRCSEIDDRIVMFPGFEEELEIAGNIYHISTHEYRKTIYPKGYYFLEHFTINEDTVTQIYLIEDIRLKKEIFMMKDSNTVVLTYTILTPDSYAKLHLRPFISFREIDGLLREMSIFDPDLKVVSDRKISVQPYKNLPPAYIYNPDGGKFKPGGVWYREFYYAKDEHDMGDSIEDLYSMGVMTFELSSNESKSMILSTEDKEILEAADLKSSFHKQIKKIKEICAETKKCVKEEGDREPIEQLVYSADSFIAKDENGKPCVYAAYPWPCHIYFRDLFGAFPGLFLVTGRFEEAKELLKAKINFEYNGLLPISMTSGKMDVSYTSADVSLWFFYALYKYLSYTKDFSIVKSDSDFFKRISWIINMYINGINNENMSYRIYKDTDGLIYATHKTEPMTWMNRKINAVPLTPRKGKAVEINALWYNAIKIMQYITEHNGEKEKSKSYKELSETIYKSFNNLFWNQKDDCLYDCIDGQFKDDSIRPNQVLAISLPFAVIDDKDKMGKIMNVAIKDLYTSFGLRTLNNMSVQFKPKCEGDRNAREAATHQGSVWLWTTGHFVTAYLKTFGKHKETMQFIRTVYEPFFESIKNGALGTISEMADGDFPYKERGKLSHAWAVGEILRSYFEDFLNNE